MKSLKIFKNLFFILIFSSSFIAQTKENYAVPTCKIAVVDSSLFEDERQGIERLVKAKSFAETVDDFGTSNFHERINKLQKEIDNLISQNKSINEKYIELQKLTSEQKQARENRESNMHKRYSLLVTPIDKKIREKLNVFTQQKGYALVIDKLETSVVIEGDTIDVTSEFIKFCNESFDKEELKTNN